MKIEFSDEEVQAILVQKACELFTPTDNKIVSAKAVDGLYKGLAAIVTIETKAEEKAGEA